MSDAVVFWTVVGAGILFLVALALGQLGRRKARVADMRESADVPDRVHKPVAAAVPKAAPKVEAAPDSKRAGAKASMPAPKPAIPKLADVHIPKFSGDELEDIDVTLVTLSPALKAKKSGDDDDGPKAEPVKVFYDDDEAVVDEPTRPVALILVSAAGHTDVGRKRRQNEDSFLVLAEASLYAIADGMGGYAGGAVASQMAVETLCTAFRSNKFVGEIQPAVPRRGAELALALQMANDAIFSVASAEEALSEMGTTVVAARFCLNKQRVYIGHVGDSRCYRVRKDTLRQLTSDHTLAAQGLKGPLANRLSRALGIGSQVTIDIVVDKPRPEDVYILCSDGLTKMMKDDEIRDTILREKDLQKSVDTLIAMANERGGKDNVTVILVRVVPGHMAGVK